MCYSLSTHREFNKLKDKGYKKYRAVFIVSDKLKFDNLDLSNIYQATFKQMQYSEDEKTNEYITKHRLSNVEIVLEVEKLKSKFPNCSIRYDLDCQKADSRYHILRSDEGYIVIGQRLTQYKSYLIKHIRNKTLVRKDI